MGKIADIKAFMAGNRNKLTPDQALKLDAEVVKSWDPSHPEAPVSTKATTDQIVSDRTIGDANRLTEIISRKEIPVSSMYPRSNEASAAAPRTVESSQHTNASLMTPSEAKG